MTFLRLDTGYVGNIGQPAKHPYFPALVLLRVIISIVVCLACSVLYTAHSGSVSPFFQAGTAALCPSAAERSSPNNLLSPRGGHRKPGPPSRYGGA